jgi:hypothetical protein
MRDDEDGVVTYTGSRHQTLRHYPTEMTGGAGPEDTMVDFGDLILMSKEEMEDLLARRKYARSRIQTRDPMDLERTNHIMTA